VPGFEFDIVRVTADPSRAISSTFDVTSPRITDFSCALIIPTHFFGGSFGTAQIHAGAGWGAADKLGSGGCNYRSAADGVGSTDSTTILSSAGVGNRCLIVAEGATQLWACTPVARSVSVVANGIRLETAVQATQPFEAIVILFGGLEGADVVAVADATWPAVALGYTPNAAVCSNNNGTGSGAGTNNNDYMPNFGVCVDDAGLTQYSIAGLWNDAQATSDSDMILNGDAGDFWLSEVTGTGAVTVTQRITAFGTQMTSTTPTGANPVAWALLMRFPTAGVRFGCAVVPFSASTGPQVFTPFAGLFTPSLVLGQACLLTAADTLTDGATAAAEGLFAFRDGASYAVATRQDEAKTTPQAASTNFDDSALLLMDDAGTTVVDASLVGFGGGGFTLNFGAAQAGHMVVLAVGTVGSHPFRELARQRAARVNRQRRPRLVLGKAAAGLVLPPAFWREVARHRELALRRRRWRAPLTTIQAPGPFVEVEEEALGRIAAPGATRGTVSEPLVHGALSAPGSTRGRVGAPGEPRSEDTPL